MNLAEATIGYSSITGPDDVPAAYQPTWLNKSNKILMDQKKQPAPVQDKIVRTRDKMTESKVQQTTLLDTAGHMLGLIRGAGIKPPADLFCLYQMYHESQGFTSPLYLHYNATGIKFAHQPGATKQPTGLPYAWWTSWDGYMAAYKHELTKGTNPLGAATLEDFAHRLKVNGYYEVSEAEYLAALKRAQQALKGFTTGAAAYEQPMSKIMAWWHHLSMLQKGGVILGTTYVGVKIITR